MLFFVKILISASLIAFVSWFAGKNPRAAGFLTALPLTSLLAIALMYFQYRDMQKLNEFAVSILVAVPVSLLFFVPFVTNRWLKLGFAPTFAAGIALLAAGYFIHKSVLQVWLKG